MVCIYRSPSQTQEQFEIFPETSWMRFQVLKACQPTGSILAGDFNVILSIWYSSDKYNGTGLEVDAFHSASLRNDPLP